MKQGGNGFLGCMRICAIALLIFAMSSYSWSQTSLPPSAPANESDAVAAAVHELQQQIVELRQEMTQMRTEVTHYRAENQVLKTELDRLRKQPASVLGASQLAGGYASSSSAANADPPAESAIQANASPAQPNSLEGRVAALEDSTQLLNSKVKDQYQTKVESASKYRVRLSGIVLMNLFNTHGAVDTEDYPSFVTGPGTSTGSLGATLRQSEIGLEVFGPTILGARTSGSIQADFAGGFTPTWSGLNSGIFRLRTASMRMDWDHTALVVGQDNLFVSPLSPTSFASLAVPAFNWAGNLWSWTPQIHVEHRFAMSDKQSFVLQGGVLDNLSGDFTSDTFNRMPQFGELSRQPAYGARTAWTRTIFGQPMTFGAAGYYSRQNWLWNHYVDGWAGMADWDIPLAPRLSLSGEFYRGRAIAGIGGGITQSVVFEGPQGPATPVRGLDDIGGWSQLKYKASSRLEFNVAAGLANPFTGEIRNAVNLGYSLPPGAPPLFIQNRSGLVNFIFRPRQNLLFSGEYRRIESHQLLDISNTADQVNLMMGILF